jgi:hypothetical protein
MPTSTIQYSNHKAVTTTSAGGSHSTTVSIYDLQLKVEELSYDISANTSQVRLTGIFKVTNKGWNPAFTSHTVTFTTKDSNNNTVDTRTISNAYYGTNYTSCSVTLTVNHDTDGSKNVSYTTTISTGSTWYLPKSGSFVTTSGALTAIPRGTSFTVYPEVDTGLDVTVSLGDPALDTYRHSLYYELDGAITNVKTKTSAVWTQAVIAWSQIVAQIGTNVTKKMVVTVETYESSSSEQPLDSRTREITVTTGKIPISFRDDGVGGVGVTLGAKAEGNGLSVQMDTTFGTPTVQQNVDFTNAIVRGATSIIRAWNGPIPSSQTETSMNADTFYKNAINTSVSTGDSSGIFEIEYGGIKVLRAGKYRLSASVWFTAASDHPRYNAVYVVRNNNADISSSGASISALGGEEMCASYTYNNVSSIIAPYLVELSENDILYLVARTRGYSGGGSRYAKHRMTYLQVEFIE